MRPKTPMTCRRPLHGQRSNSSEARFLRARGRHRSRLHLERLEDRTLLSGPGDDFPDALDQAALITLAADGSRAQAGCIETALDVDAFRLVAPLTGNLSIQTEVEQGSNLFPSWIIFNSDQQEVWRWYTRWVGTPSPFRMLAGRT